MTRAASTRTTSSRAISTRRKSPRPVPGASSEGIGSGFFGHGFLGHRAFSNKTLSYIAIGCVAGLLLCGAVRAQEGAASGSPPNPGSPPSPSGPIEKDPPSNEPTPEREVTIPFDPGFVYEFEWRHHDKPVGATQITVSPDPAGYRFHAEWRLSAGGGNLTSQSETLVDANLHPIELVTQRGLTTTNRGQGGKRVRVVCKEGVAEVSVHIAGREPKQHAMDYPQSCYFYEDVYFEHLLLLGAVLVNGGDHRKLRLLRPSDREIMEMRFERKELEQTSRGSLQRWRATHPEMKLTLWIDDKGMIQRATQDGSLKTEILLKSRTAIDPQGEPTKKSR